MMRLKTITVSEFKGKQISFKGRQALARVTGSTPSS